jgi:hypothetical protein
MKRKELEKLLSRLDLKNQDSADFSGFKDPTRAEKSFKRLVYIKENMPSHDKDFSPFFIESVMGRINNLSGNPGVVEYLSMQFSRVMAYGMAAVIIVFLTLFFLHGQEGFGAILGADNSNDINFISYLFYDF